MAKKPLFPAVLPAAAAFVVLAIPIFAQALSLSSILHGAELSAPDSTVAYNSQNMPLLSPAINLDPNPAQGGGDISVYDGAALAPQEGPSGTAADINEWPTSSQVSVYTVHSGDTLSGIAAMFGVSVSTIIWANNIQGGVIHPGDMLVILPITGVRHTVTAGETVVSIAKKFNSNADDIAQYNGLDPSAPLASGTTIIIPDGEIQGSMSSTSAPGAGSSHRVPSKEPYLGGSGPNYDGYYSWPVAGGVITQGLHGWNAVDIGASRGTPIYAAADGIVIVARDNGAWNGGYGNYIVIAHNNGTQTLYAHASKVLVSAGDAVTQGQTVALVGATGEATGPHLHFEVRGAQNPFASLAVGSAY